MTFRLHHAATAAALLLAGAGALAQTPPQPTPQTPAVPPNPQVIEPQVVRRDVKLPKFPSNDIEFGILGGTYATQNFGTTSLAGARLGYHITEDFFVSAQYGETKVSDKDFAKVIPGGGGILPSRTEKLTFYNVSLGYNVISGEAFFGKNWAFPLQGYVAAGTGSTDFAGQKKQTVNYGFGLRLYLHDRFGVQADVRQHRFALDLLGERVNTTNLEVNVGLTVYF
jgi:outer membrane beta-barrel protein